MCGAVATGYVVIVNLTEGPTLVYPEQPVAAVLILTV